MIEERESYLKKAFEQIGISLSELQISQFLTYYEMLIEKNKVMNLTAITDFEEVVLKHFVDSLMFQKAFCGGGAVSSSEFTGKGVKLIDIGTGAGFPGLPLKIVYPELKITLLDSLNKRVLFLQEVISALKLENIEALHGRAEDIAQQPNYREQFQYAVSRAVANLSTLTEYCLPFVELNGQFISYKSGAIEEELKKAQKAINILGGKLSDTVVFELPDSDMARSLVIINKSKKTAKKYPRKAGLPGKEPL